MIEILKCLSDSNRLRILALLNKVEECCACDLEESLDITQSNLSKHISKLKNENLITVRKNGRWKYYSLNSDLLNKYKFLKVLFNEVEIPKEDYESFLILQKNKLTRCEEE